MVRTPLSFHQVNVFLRFGQVQNQRKVCQLPGLLPDRTGHDGRLVPAMMKHQAGAPLRSGAYPGKRPILLFVTMRKIGMLLIKGMNIHLID